MGSDPKAKGVEEQRTNTAVGTGRANGGHRFGRQTAPNNGARPGSRIEEDFPNDLAVGATGVATEPDHHDGEKLNAAVSEGVIETQSVGHSNKEDAREHGVVSYARIGSW